MPAKEWTFPGTATVAMAPVVAVTAGLLILAGPARAGGVINTTFIGGNIAKGDANWPKIAARLAA